MSRRVSAPALIAVVVFTFCALTVSTATPTPLEALALTSASFRSPAALVRLGSGASSIPTGSEITGAPAATTSLSVEIALDPADPGALRDFVAAVSDPRSPDYRHYLSPGAFGERFGASGTTLEQVRAWLRARGIEEIATDPDRLSVKFQTTVRRIEAAFDVRIDRYSAPGGPTRFAPTSAPLVPRSIAPRIEGILGLTDIGVPRPLIVDGEHSTVPAPAMSRSTHAAEGAAPKACSAAAEQAALDQSYTPDELASAYSMPAAYAEDRFGAGISVALFELEPFSGSDIAAFQSCFDTHAPVSVTEVDGGSGSGTGTGEAALDIEQVIGLAPGASVHVYEGVPFSRATDADALDIYKRIADDDTAAVVSSSWGACEAELSPGFAGAEEGVFEQMAAQGQSMFAASGDSGSEDCFVAGQSEDSALQVDDPGSQPDVTSVGGTSLSSLGPPPSETTWNGCEGDPEQQCAALGPPFGAGGGGISSIWPMPAWEVGPGVINAFSSGAPCRKTSGDCREVPDVSSSADPAHGDVIYYAGSWQTVGGTSGSAPLWAALTAVADQGCVEPGRSLAESHVVGFANPKIYTLASRTSPPYHDITTGNNDFTDSNAGRYPATSRYDMATGWGSPIGSSLVRDLQPAGGCPSVAAVSPSGGPTAGGTVVTIRGSDLAGVTSVHFGSAAATGVSYNPGLGVVTATSPAYPVRGGVYVTVTTANGTSAEDGPAEFGYSGPSVASVVPPGGAPAGGTDVDIAGGGFSGATSVHFGTVSARSFRVLSDSLVAAVSPSGADGTVVDVTVTTPSGISPRFSQDRFSYTLRPVVGRVTPGSGSVRGGTRVTISGANLGSATAVHFGVMSSKFSESGPNAIAAIAPPSATGARVVSVTVANEFGSSAPSGSAEYRYVSPPPGYWLVASDGGVFSFGGARFSGSEGGRHLNAPIVGIAATGDDGGYWMAASDGGVFSFGDARFSGSMGGRHLNDPIVGIAATVGGYWLVASDGGVFSFGDARYSGSMGGRHLNEPIVGIGATADGGGYWLVASDGGVFSFGDARYSGSMGGRHLNEPIVGIAATVDDGGYWMVASDGGVFSFGDARFSGSMGGRHLNEPIVGIAPASSDSGYWLVASDGGIFSFAARFSGSAAYLRLVASIVGVAST